MKTVLITGSGGFIGKNLSAHLQLHEEFRPMPLHRDSTKAEICHAIGQADFICHLAGSNRPDNDEEFAAVNTGFTEFLCQLICQSKRRIPIIFASSIHVERDNPYGKSKLAAERLLIKYSEETGVPVHICRLSHVIGKWCQPNYNSVVATFCHNIARDLPIQIHDPDYLLNVIHVDDLVESFVQIIAGKETQSPYCEAGPYYKITVGELAEQLTRFRESRASLVTERVGTALTRILYATYISYLPQKDFVYEIPKYGDARGSFVEILKTRDSGQFSFFSAKPGVTRGEHYHHAKVEKFLVVKGRAKFRFRHILSGEFCEIATSEERPEIVETIPGWAHDVTNVGEEDLIVMLWANEMFDRSHPDTYPFRVKETES